MARQRLTTRLLSTLSPGQRALDDAVRGVFAEAWADGTVSLRLRTELRGKTIKVTLGRWPELSLDDARAQALALLAEVRAGRDPRAQNVTESSVWTVGHAFGKYIDDLAKRPGTERSQLDMRNRLARYLEDWRELPLASLTKELVEARQAQVAAQIRARARQRGATGARTANAVVRDLGAVWDFAADYTPLPAVSPCRRVVMIGEVREHHEIPVAELRAWWAAVGELGNPLRRAMHRLGLLSGLRPGNLVAIRREWVQLATLVTDAPDGAPLIVTVGRVDFPAHAMKGRRTFALPLSAPMAALVEEALAAGDVLAPGTPWLFPGEGKSGHISVTREKAPALKNRTGHALRHTWKTCARLARVPESTIEILLAHRLGGMHDTYGSLADQFDLLYEAQCQVSAWILARAGSV